jgi:predicted phosphoadenosine phosphosulfate sulfurtransferase
VPKKPLGKDVLTATRERIAFVFDTFQRIYVSFSGGKDSTVMLHLVMEEARKRQRKVGVLFVDFEAQYKLTIDHIREMFSLYKENIDPYWVAIPIALRNAVSVFEPKWLCWDPSRKADWVRKPARGSITDGTVFPFYGGPMEFEEFIPQFSRWYADGALTACLVGIRTDESLNRYRTLTGKKKCYKGIPWTTFVSDSVYNVYPIYDWRTKDLWTYHARTKKPYNRLYDLMHKAGLTISQARICQPFGDAQRRGLWMFHVIEPETWAKVVRRVNGANSGALYSRDVGNMQGHRVITKPPGHTWESFAKLLLASMPDKTRAHYTERITSFIKWWSTRGYPNGIPDELDLNAEAGKVGPSWRRVCKVLLRNDYWCRGLSFCQLSTQAYKRYLKLKKERAQHAR